MITGLGVLAELILLGSTIVATARHLTTWTDSKVGMIRYLQVTPRETIKTKYIS